MTHSWRQPDAADAPDLSSPQAAAGYWDSRLRAPDCTDEERAAFARWRDADRAHAVAFEQLQLIIQELRDARHRPELRAMRDTALSRTRQARTRWFARAATIAALAVGIGLTAYWVEQGDLADLPFLPSALETGPRTLATAVGGRSTMTLADGSVVTLNTQSRVTIDYEKQERHVNLLYGQAMFEVAKDPDRQFVVTVGEQRIIAIGTAFDVRKGADRVSVTMVEGRAAVETPTPETGSAVPSERRTTRTEVSAGEQLIAMTGAAAPEVRPARVELVTSWRNGVLDFRASTLAEAVEEINRYSTTQVVLADEEMGELRVNGVFRTGQVTTFVNAMRDVYAIDARPGAEDEIRLEWRR